MPVIEQTCNLKAEVVLKCRLAIYNRTSEMSADVILACTLNKVIPVPEVPYKLTLFTNVTLDCKDNYTRTARAQWNSTTIGTTKDSYGRHTICKPRVIPARYGKVKATSANLTGSSATVSMMPSIFKSVPGVRLAANSVDVSTGSVIINHDFYSPCNEKTIGAFRQRVESPNIIKGEEVTLSGFDTISKDNVITPSIINGKHKVILSTANMTVVEIDPPLPEDALPMEFDRLGYITSPRSPLIATSNLTYLRKSIVSINMETLDIPWEPGQNYTFEVSSDFVTDTEKPDYNNPSKSIPYTANSELDIVSSIPANGDLETDVNDYIKLDFGRDVIPYDTGNFYLYEVGPITDNLVKSVPVNKFMIEDNIVILDVKGSMLPEKTYYVTSDKNVLIDFDNFLFYGITDKYKLRFTTAMEPWFKDLIAIQTSFGTTSINYIRYRNVPSTLSTQFTALPRPVATHRARANFTAFASELTLGRRVKIFRASLQSSASLEINGGKASFAQSEMFVSTNLNAMVEDLDITDVSMAVSTEMFVDALCLVIIESNTSSETSMTVEAIRYPGIISNEIAVSALTIDSIRYPGIIKDLPSTFTESISETTSGQQYIIPYTVDGQRSISATNDTLIAIPAAGGGSYIDINIYNLATGALVHTIIHSFTSRIVSLDFSNDYLLVGSEVEYSGTFPYTYGKISLYRTSDWSLVHSNTNPNVNTTSAYDGFGHYVKLTNNYYISSAPFEDTSTKTDTGRIYVYSLDTGTLLYTIEDLYNVNINDRLGIKFSANNDYIMAYNPVYGNSDISVHNVSDGSVVINSIKDLLVSLGYTSNQDIGDLVSASDTKLIVSGWTYGTPSLARYLYIIDIETWTVDLVISDNASSSNDQMQSISNINNGLIVVGHSTKWVDGASGVAYVYDISTGAIVRTFKNRTGSNPVINSIYSYAQDPVTIKNNYVSIPNGTMNVVYKINL